jgi:hypothetical protein
MAFLLIHEGLFFETTHNTYNRQTSMPLVGFESTITAGERPQTYVLDRAATETGQVLHIQVYSLNLHKGNRNNLCQIILHFSVSVGDTQYFTSLSKMLIHLEC